MDKLSLVFILESNVDALLQEVVSERVYNEAGYHIEPKWCPQLLNIVSLCQANKQAVNHRTIIDDIPGVKLPIKPATITQCLRTLCATTWLLAGLATASAVRYATRN